MGIPNAYGQSSGVWMICIVYGQGNHQEYKWFLLCIKVKTWSMDNMYCAY